MTIRHMDTAAKAVQMSEEDLMDALRSMEANPALRTNPVLISGADEPKQHISFYKKHLNYLLSHPKVGREQYLTNLRTMIKIRP